MSIELNNLNFEEIINLDKLTILDFFAEWCGPCKMLAPIIEEISNENKDIIVYKINVDDNPEIVSKYNIRNIPAILFIKNNIVVDKIIGSLPKNKILEKINILK